MIHRFNDMGMASLDPQWAGGRPRQITTDDERSSSRRPPTRPEKLGQPFTRWSLRKLAAYLAENDARVVTVGRERLRQLLAANAVTFQRTKTWKESNDPDRDAKLDRIEEVLEHRPDRTLRVRRVRPAEHPPGRRVVLGAGSEPQRQPGELPQAPRGPAVPRLLLDRRRPPLGCGAQPQVRRQRPRRAEADPARATRRRISLRDPRQPLRAQGHHGSASGPNGTRSSCASPRPTAHGPTRSRPTSGRYASSC